MPRIDDLSRAIAGFAESLGAADDLGGLQRRCLDGVREFVPCFGVGIYVFDPAVGRVRAAEALGVSDFFMDRYEECGRAIDPVLAEVSRMHSAVTNLQLMSPDEWRISPFYREVLHLHRMRFLLQAPVMSGGRMVGTLNFGRHAEEGAFTDAERAVADLVGRVVGIAVSALDARADAGAERAVALATLDLVGDAVVVTDAATGDRTPNAAARALLRRIEGGGLRLGELISYPEAPGGVAAGELDVRLTDGGAARLAARTTVLAERPSITVSFLTLGNGSPAAVPAQLTDRERDVSELAAAGLHDREIAERLFLSPHTVKQHLKSTYRKLGVRSRVDLARLLAGRTGPPS